MRQALPEARTPDDVPAPGSIMGGMALAGALIAYGLRRRGIVGGAVGIAGAGLLASLVTPRVAPRVARAATSRRAIDVEGSFVVQRPVAEVFSFFRNFEHFPLFGGLLHSVDDFDDGRSRWRVMGHDGALVEWNVIVTKYVPSRVIAWESVAGGPVESRGTVRLHATSEVTTRIDVTLHYLPLTDAAARAFRPFVARGPERRMRDSITRIEAAMQQAEQPGFYDREPAHPLPDPTIPD